MNVARMNTSVLAGERVTDNRPTPATGQVTIRLPGLCQGQRSQISLTDEDLSRHLLLIGGTGCGKTNTIHTMVSQIKRSMTTDDVMIIFDTKGDYYHRFYTAGDVVIGNSSDFRSISAKWNIYKDILSGATDWQDIEANAQEIAMSLFAEAIGQNSSNPFFPMAAQDLFATLLLYFIKNTENDTAKKNVKLHNRYLRNILDTIEIDILNVMLSDPQYRSVLSYIGTADNPQGQGVLAEMRNVVSRIFRGSFAEKGGFSIREMVRKKSGRTLFIEYDLEVGSVLTPMYRLLVDLALKEALSRKMAAGNVYLICDEFKLLPLLNHIEDAVNFGRSLGVKVIAGIQSVQQITQVYGEERGNNILAGFSSIFGFKPNDYVSRKYISDLYGTNYLYEQYQGTGGVITGSERTGKTVEDWDISRLKPGQAIVGVRLEAPYIYQFDLFQGK